jgi:signal transduction histidine kinase
VNECPLCGIYPIVVETLRQDGDFVTSRAKNQAGLPPWLLVSAVSERPASEILAQLHGEAGVLVKVQDTGEGLDPQLVDQIFNAFETTKSGGLGMGLSIRRSIVENHDGQLWATANGPGATFEFTLFNRVRRWRSKGVFSG